MSFTRMSYRDMVRRSAAPLIIAALTTTGRAEADVAPHELPPPTSHPTGRIDGWVGLGAEILYPAWIGSATFGQSPAPATPSAVTPWGKEIADWYRPGPMLGLSLVTGGREGYVGVAVRTAAWTPMPSVKEPSHLELALTMRGIVGETVGFAYGFDVGYFTMSQEITGGELHMEGAFLAATAGPTFTPTWARRMTFEPYATLGMAILARPTLNDAKSDDGDAAAAQLRAGMRLTLTL